MNFSLAKVWIRQVLLFVFSIGCVDSTLFAETGLDRFPDWKGARLEGTGADPLPFQTVPVFDHLPWKQTICMTRVPDGTSELGERYLVVERWGTLWILFVDEGRREKFFEFPGVDGKKPVTMGAVFHPKFPVIPYVFVSSNQEEGGTAINRLHRFRVHTDDLLSVEAASEKILLQWESNGHRGGDLKFGADGFLYVSTGDGSSPGDPMNLGQRADLLSASILRLDIDTFDDEKGYRVPADNPFVGIQNVRPEIWAYGLRNPWRMNFRPGTNELWLGDNGDEHWEMVHRIERGGNYGWSVFEGSHPFRIENELAGPNREHSPPVVEHSHQEMRSVIGGLWYRGTQFPELSGQYLYGCHFTRKLWGFGMDGNDPETPARLADTGGQIVSFAEDDSHEVYVVTLDRGIMRLKRSPRRESMRPIPPLLSETGLFKSVEEHLVGDGLLPYEINVPLWWDGARRERFMGISRGQRVLFQVKPPGLNEVDNVKFRTMAGLDRWKMPTGSVFLQTFYLGEGAGERRIETQISLKDQGEWRFLSYRWNQAQSDAHLVSEDGEDHVIELARHTGARGTLKRQWRFPARAECTACHTQRSMFVLGINMGQLNREFDYRPLGGRLGNQMETLHGLGFFQGGFKLPPASKMTRMPDPSDSSLKLEDRARSYLHVNCAHCHRESGLGGRGHFELLHWLHNDELGAIGARPLVGLPGIDPGVSRVISPGIPEHSEIYRRMMAADAGRMPMLGGGQRDDRGAELISEWIQSLE